MSAAPTTGESEGKTQPADCVRSLYEAFARNDIERVKELCDEDIVFDWTPDTQYSKHSAKGRGKDNFLKRLEDLAGDFEYESVSPTGFISEGERVAVQVEVRMTGRSTARSIVLRGADFWTVRKGRIVELVQYYDSALAASVLA